MNTVKYNIQQNDTLWKYPLTILSVAFILYFGSTLFIPLFFGLLIAIFMFPLCKWLEISGLNRSFSVGICLLIVTIFIAIFSIFIVWQIGIFAKDARAFSKDMVSIYQQFQLWMSNNTGLSFSKQSSLGDRFGSAFLNLLGSGMRTTADTLFVLFLTPIYTALLLYHRGTFVRYLKTVSPARYKTKLDIILEQTIRTYFDYIKGMVLVYVCVGALNSIGLLLLGVDHAILFGVLCAIMTIIPYIGIIASALLPISVVWLQTSNVWYPIGVVAIFSVVQYLEANVIFPKVVGTQLNVSTMAILVAVIAGGIIWGVAGMILFIPFAGILKIVSDHIEEWKPINLLLIRN